MSHILAIGIATVDIINYVATYPAEDSEVRALAQRIARGGNATNTLSVLSQLGHQVAWGGVLADDADSANILSDLNVYRVDMRYVQRQAHGKNPTSYILMSQDNGARSIVHYRDLPEFSYADFEGIDLSDFDWLHFEGRNVEDTARMLQHARKTAPALRISLEIEKPRPDIERLLSVPDVIFFSRCYAQEKGYDKPDALLRAVTAQAPHADLFCAWGADGAAALSREGVAYASVAFPPERALDTLGAGDTFNAGIIDARLRGLGLDEALISACKLAGRKCAQLGFAGLCD